jgi:hypothetical protein
MDVPASAMTVTAPPHQVTVQALQTSEEKLTYTNGSSRAAPMETVHIK